MAVYLTHEPVMRLVQRGADIPLDQLGTTDDCGFSPFISDYSTSRDTAFAKIAAVELGYEPVLPLTLSRDAVEDVFRTLATERGVDRAQRKQAIAHHPGAHADQQNASDTPLHQEPGQGPSRTRRPGEPPLNLPLRGGKARLPAASPWS